MPTKKIVPADDRVSALNVKANAASSVIPSKKLRISLQSGSMGVMLAADLLGAKDTDNEGWDDYFASKLRDIALDMQHVALTGRLPTDGNE